MRWLALVILLMAESVGAAPDTSVRPVARAGAAASTLPVQLQPSGAISAPERSVEGQVAAVRGQGVTTSIRPQVRTRKIERRAKRALKEQGRLRAKGAICGDPDIQGEPVGRVRAKTNGCGIVDGVRVRSVSGIALSQRAVMDCTTAKALKTWVDASAKPTFQRVGGGLKGLRVAAHYICRTRNNKPGARISEHGRGKAIDISGFQLRDGSTVSVLKGWNAKGTADAMRKVHREACGTFGTVLGPKADRHHKDHFHFDTARHGIGAYCR